MGIFPPMKRSTLIVPAGKAKSRANTAFRKLLLYPFTRRAGLEAWRAVIVKPHELIVSYPRACPFATTVAPASHSAAINQELNDLAVVGAAIAIKHARLTVGFSH